MPPLQNMREAERNDQLRRADWRFLLRLTDEPTSICLGSGRLTELVALVSTPVRGGVHTDPVDLAVVGEPSNRSLAIAWRGLRPGGSLYVESPKPHLSEARLRRRVADAGFVDLCGYMPWPWPSRAPSSWLPLDPQADELLSSSGPPRSWREAIARAVWRISRRLGVIFPLRLVAQKPGGSSDEITDLIREKWSAWGLDGSPDRLRWLLLTGGERSINKVVALVLADSGTRPRLVVKFPRSEAGEEELRHEHETLGVLERTRPSLDGVPRPLFVGRRCGRLCIGETALGGASLMLQLNPTNYDEYAARVTDWLIDLAGTNPPAPRAMWSPRLVEEPQHEFETRFGRVVSESDLERTREVLSRGGDLPLVPEHRDCSPWNILIGEGGRLGVVDWESSEPNGLPGLDLIYFLTYASLVIEDAFDLPAARMAYARMREPSTLTGAVVAECERSYIERLGLAPDVLAPLRLLCWVVHSRSEYRRLEQDVGGVPSSDALLGSLFLALWHEELRSAP
jgi:hypothetical protein